MASHYPFLVNAGAVRVLIGSTPKMGAGMNAQERMVALHHLDSPWRPSDVEQREGRLVRQGNALYELDPENFKAAIYAYSTSGTFDAVMWQILDRKQQMLDDFRAGKDTIEDTSDDAASFADFMAETTGSTAFKEKHRLEKEIKALVATKNQILTRRRSAEQGLRYNERQRDASEADIARAERLEEALKGVENDNFTYKGAEYVNDIDEIESKERARIAAINEKEAAAHKAIADPIIEKAQEKYGADVTREGLKAYNEYVDEQLEKAGIGRYPKTVFYDRDKIAKKDPSGATAAAVRIRKEINALPKEEGGDVSFNLGGVKITCKVIPLGNKDKEGKDTGHSDYKFFVNGLYVGAVTKQIALGWDEFHKYLSADSIRAIVARNKQNAETRITYLDKDDQRYRQTLEKLQFKDEAKLAEKKERYEDVVDEVADIEREIAERRAAEQNQYIDQDVRRFGDYIPRAEERVRRDTLSKAEKDALRAQASESWEEYQGDDDAYPIWAAKVAKAKAILSAYGEGDLEAAQDTLKMAKDAWDEDNDGKPYPQEFQSVQNIITSIRQGQGRLFKGYKYSVRGAGRGQMPTLAAVQKIFVGQDVWQLENGSIAVATRGGHTVVIRNVESITADRVSLQVGYGRAEVGAGKTITGAYYSDKTTQGFTEGVIHLNRTAADTWTLAHESMHFLEDAGILSQFDVITLKGHIKGLVKAGKFETRNQQDIGGAEDRADFLAQQLTAKEAPTGAIANIVARIRAFIDKLVNAFGIRTPGGIVRDIESGRIYERGGGKAVSSRTSYSMEKKSFPEQLDNLVAGKLNPLEPLLVGDTPYILERIGAGRLPLTITQKAIKKITTGKHGIAIETLKQLPEHIADPIMVFDSATQGESLVVMTELKQDGKTIVAAIHLSKESGRNIVNEIASVHPRQSEYHFINWIHQGLLRYMNKKKSQAWSVTSGLQLPTVRGSIRGFGKKILYDYDIVKGKYEISAYSGGAADIGQSPEGRFSTKYIGTGTNSTAFGWGLYFTSKAEVANVYANLATKMKGGPVKGGRHIHAVTLHQGKTPDQYDYIDWHGKLTDRQATKLRNRIQASGYVNAGGKAAQGALYGGAGGQTYETLAEMLGSKEEASRFLLKAGIDGITYRADYVMDNAPEGTRNYVVFDDNAVTMGRHVQYSVRDLFTQKQKNDPVESSSLFPEVDARLKAAKGIKTAGLKDRARDTLVEGFQHFTRHFQHLDPKKDGAIIDVLRQFQEVPVWSKEETANRLVDFVGKLSPNGRDVFTMNILLPDMLRDIDSGLLDPTSEEGLPFGYKDRAQVEEDLANYQSKRTPDIEAALEKRNEFMRNLTDSLITHKLLSKELANDPGAYFHHQVLAYMNYKDNPAWGLSSTDVRTHRKGWQLSRKGSRLDYNTEYVESEFEVVSQALAQVETAKTLKKVEELADIKPRLTQEARQQNMAEFRRWEAENSPLEDPLKPFKVKMAMGFAKLTKMLENGAINVPPEFEGVAEHFIEQAEGLRAARGGRDIAEVIAPHPMTFPFLSWLMNNSTEGLMPAGMIFKAIAQRNQFIKQAVGDKWVTYRGLVPEGYVLHKPEASSTFYFANSLADKTVEQVIYGQKALEAADIRKVLARGRDAEWVLPEGVSKTLNEFRPNKADSLPGRISKDVLSTWKQWILINPFRVLKYNVNNMSGDLDICMAYDPKIITGYLLPAFKDLWAQYKGTAPESLKGKMSALARKGLISSGMTAMDIPELNDVGSTKALVDFMDGKSKGALMWWWSHSKKLTTLRENALRLAAYRYFKNELSAGHAVYGASRKAEIDAVQDKDDRAVKLARELIGDYGNISHAGQYIRERLIPFYSWAEINAPRYVRLFRNLKHEGGSMTGLAGTMAWKATKLGLKASALMVMVALWNGALFPDEEEELQETGREQLHLILGRRADGSIITLRFQGALSDALSWFGMSNPIEEAKQIAKGRKSSGDVAKEMAKGAPLKMFQGLRPEPKLLYEVASGQSFYPDPTKARPIRDTGEHIARLFSLDKIYNRLAGKPLRGGDWASQLKSDVQGLLLAESDPGEQAYYTSRKYVFEWLEKNGQERPVATPTNRSNALYYYKQALRFGDFDAAAKYLNKYKELGGKETNVSAAIKRAAPLASLKLADRYKFKQSLTPEQQQTLIVAHEWYKRHYVETRTEEYKQRLSVG